MGKRIVIVTFLVSCAVIATAQDDFKFNPSDELGQRQYDEFLKATEPERMMEDSLLHLETKKYFELDGDDAALKPYRQQLAQARRLHHEARIRFVASHPDYSVSAAFVKSMLRQKFTYTAAGLDSMARMVSVCPDTVYTNYIDSHLERAKRFTLGTAFTDFEGIQPQGGVKRISELMLPDKYTLIDFWASWCGPCRRAIPQVKAIYEANRDRLQVVSVSIDEKEDRWRKAEQAEQMPWPQLWLDKDRLKSPVLAYAIKSIPRLVLIGPDGRIVAVTFEPDAIEESLH